MKLFLSWLLVALPLGWGVMQSIKKATPLFTQPPVQNAPAALP
jgi:hypothetical protein